MRELGERERVTSARLPSIKNQSRTRKSSSVEGTVDLILVQFHTVFFPFSFQVSLDFLKQIAECKKEEGRTTTCPPPSSIQAHCA